MIHDSHDDDLAAEVEPSAADRPNRIPQRRQVSPAKSQPLPWKATKEPELWRTEVRAQCTLRERVDRELTGVSVRGHRTAERDAIRAFKSGTISRRSGLPEASPAHRRRPRRARKVRPPTGSQVQPQAV